VPHVETPRAARPALQVLVVHTQPLIRAAKQPPSAIEIGRARHPSPLRQVTLADWLCVAH
jgi:hypothetical protein